MTKKILFLSVCMWIVSVLSSMVCAQDALTYSQRDLLGTARYTAMGGAMTAVGADPSAVLDNPAALALYRRMELHTTLYERIDYNQQIGYGEQMRSNFMLPQVSLVFALRNQAEHGVKYLNFMFGYNRIHSMNRSTLCKNPFLQTSLTNLMVEQAQGSSTNLLESSRYTSDNTSWLSELGYWNYLIDPVNSYDKTSSEWTTEFPTAKSSQLTLNETGYVDQYAIDFAANINEYWHIGLGLNILSTYYIAESRYYETYLTLASSQLNSYLRQTGLGVSGSLGMMWQPIQALRMGLSFTSPSLLKLSTRTNASMQAMLDTATYDETPVYLGTQSLKQPLRLSAGICGILGERGLLTLQYDYRHGKNLNDIHTFHIGGEYVIVRNLFLNAGYAYESALTETYKTYPLALNDVRTDTYNRAFERTHFASGGIGYRSNAVIVQLAYQYRQQRYLLSPFILQDSLLGNSQDMRSKTHHIVLSLGWHF